MKTILVIFALFVGAQAFPKLLVGPDAKELILQMKENFHKWSPRKQLETTNDFADVIIEEVGHYLKDNGYEPLPLTNFHRNLTIGGKLVSFSLNNGKAHNVTSIYRSGDVSFRHLDRHIYFDVPIFFKQMLIEYDYETILLDEEFRGKVNGNVLIVDVFFTLDLDFSELEIALEEFEIPNIGYLDVNFENGMHDWLINRLSKVVLSTFKDQVIDVVELVTSITLNYIFDVVNKILENLKPY